MVILFTILLILCLAFPLFHTFNAFWGSKKSPSYLKTVTNEEQGISILIPCYNEEFILATSIKGLESLNYHNYELIYINDGSTDSSLEVLIKNLELYPEETLYNVPNNLMFMPVKNNYRSRLFPNVRVLDKSNGGKSDSLNAGIAYATKEVIITLDADSILDADALVIINQVFADSNVIAAGGNVHILQGFSLTDNHLIPTLFNMKQIVRFQIIEYLRGFYIFKYSLAKANALSIISGAFGIFNRDVLINVGGYRRTVGEDIDITLKIQKYAMTQINAKILFIPEAICFTEVPESWGDLYKQRIRWQKALIDCFILYFTTFSKSIFKNKISFFFLIDSMICGVFASYITVFFVIWLLVYLTSVTSDLYIVYIGISLFVNLLYTITSIKIASTFGHFYSHKNYLQLILTIVLDLLFYRFINLIFVMIGSLAYFTNKHDWNKVSRTGRIYQLKSAKKAAT